MLVRQVELLSVNKHMITWVRSDLAVVGKKLKHKKLASVWTVCMAYAIELPIDRINKDWRVGGL